MPFLVVGGITLQVVSTGATEQAPLYIGAHLRTDDGRQAGYIRSEIPRRQFTTYDLTPAAWAALEAACPPGAPVPCSGDALADAGGATDYLVTLRAAMEWDPDAQGGLGDIVHTATLSLEPWGAV